MAGKDHKLKWSTTAASNTDIANIGIQGTNLPSNFDNALREYMKEEADAVTRHVVKTVGSYTPVLTDHNQFWRCTGAVTLNLTAAATLTDGWALWIRANGGAVTIDPSGAETIDGAATLVLVDGQQAVVICTGTTFFTVMVGGTGGALAGSGLTLTSTDAGAAAGPTLDLYRDSASPLAADAIGEIQFNGEDSAGNKQAYASITGIIDDPTSTSEDGSVLIKAVSAGTLSDAFTIYSGVAQVNGGGTTPKLRTDGDDNELILQGGNTNSQGGSIHLFGDAHASAANDVWIVTGATTVYQWDDSTSQHQLTGAAYISGVTRVGQNTTDTPGSGNNTVGVGIITTGQGCFSTAGSTGAVVANKTTDGSVVSLNSAGTVQGSISIAGAVTSYNAFFGSHWSQMMDGSKPDILRGTIVESIDQMSAWPGEAPEERLPCFKISDTPGSRSVYGVFAWWDEDWTATNDALVGALGAFVIRIAPGVIVQRGDYIESNGDGCGRVQADDILRSSTVAKVTSTTVVETYPDGSYLVPCTLHCG